MSQPAFSAPLPFDLVYDDVEAERRRIEAERQRFESERQRADAEHQRAEQAEAEVARLRALLEERERTGSA